MNTLPKDPVMLLSVINTKLRDDYPDLETLCEDLEINQKETEKVLESIDYFYDREKNRFL